MTATDFFAEANGFEKPDVGKNEWGGTVGGPIIRNKLHFFGSLERLILNRNFTTLSGAALAELVGSGQ